MTKKINKKNIKHIGEKVYNKGEYVVNCGDEFIDIITTYDLLEVLKTTKFNSTFYNDINETLLEYVEYDDNFNILCEFGKELDKVCIDLYNDYKKTKIEIKSIDVNKNELLENYYGHGGGVFLFFKKDLNYLKGLKQEQTITSSYSGSKTYGIFINVSNIEIYDIVRSQVIKYSGEIQIFQDKNELGFGILDLINIKSDYYKTY